MTGSRAALVSLVVAAALILMLRSPRWIWAWGSACVFAIAGLAAFGRLGTAVRLLVSDETLSTKLLSRLDIWHSALMGVQDHLFTGIGLGVFNQVIPVRYPFQSVSLSFSVSQAHNLFLDVALSIGVPGLLGLLLLLAGLVLLAVGEIKQGYYAGIISVGVLASLLAFLVFGITDSMSLSRPTSFILWVWACAVVLNRAHAGDGEASAGSDLQG